MRQTCGNIEKTISWKHPRNNPEYPGNLCKCIWKISQKYIGKNCFLLSKIYWKYPKNICTEGKNNIPWQSRNMPVDSDPKNARNIPKRSLSTIFFYQGYMSGVTECDTSMFFVFFGKFAFLNLIWNRISCFYHQNFFLVSDFFSEKRCPLNGFQAANAAQAKPTHPN